MKFNWTEGKIPNPKKKLKDLNRWDVYRGFEGPAIFLGFDSFSNRAVIISLNVETYLFNSDIEKEVEVIGKVDSINLLSL